LFSILRNAKTGPAVEAAQLRAAYATILESTGPVELAKWAQQAIDTGDAILADAVVRENGTRKQDERPFLTATLLKLLPNAEHQQAQALLQEVINLSQQGGIAYSEFERGQSTPWPASRWASASARALRK
jgi:hypothetical protein